MFGWFPKWNSRGDIASSGLGKVAVTRRGEETPQVIADGYGPAWYGDDDRLIYNASNNEEVTEIFDLRSRQVIERIRPGYNTTICNGTGRKWLGARPPNITIYDGTAVVQQVTSAGAPAMNRRGDVAWVAPYHTPDKHVFFNGLVLTGPPDDIHSVSLCNAAIIWLVATGIHTRAVRGQMFGGPVQDLSVLNWESPHVVDTPDGPWIVSTTQGGLMARPFGSHEGYAWSGDQFYNPDSIYMDGKLYIAYSTASGALQKLPVDLSAPRVDLRSYQALWNVGAPAPQPPTLPAPEEPSVSIAIPNLFHILQEVDAKYPALLQENSKASCTEFLWRAATALAEFDPGFGLLTKGHHENHTVIAGHLVAVDAVTYRKNGITSDHVVDILKGAHDGPGKGGITWGLHTRRASNLWLQVPPRETVEPQPERSPVPDQEPSPQPAAADLQRLLDSLEKMRTEIEILKIGFQTAADTIKDLSTKLDTVKAAKLSIVADPNGPFALQTDKVWGHTHTLRFKITQS